MTTPKTFEFFRCALPTAAACAALSAGCGSSPVRAPTTPTVAPKTATTTTTTAHRRPRPRGAAALIGAWNAVGYVQRTKNMGNEIKGDELHRRWFFERRCAQGKCRILFTRETDTTPLTAALVRRGDHWEARWIFRFRGHDEVQHTNWTLRLTGPRIVAMERTRINGCTCPPASDATRWVGQR